MEGLDPPGQHCGLLLPVFEASLHPFLTVEPAIGRAQRGS